MCCQLIAKPSPLMQHTKLARMFQDEQSYSSVAVTGQRCCAYCKHFALTECHASGQSSPWCLDSGSSIICLHNPSTTTTTLFIPQQYSIIITVLLLVEVELQLIDNILVSFQFLSKLRLFKRQFLLHKHISTFCLIKQVCKNFLEFLT